MPISEKKMQIVMNNYFNAECTMNTSIREAFEKGFRIGVQKGYETAKPAEITLESAIDYLQSTGWLQEHDRILTEFAEPERRWTPVTEALPEEDKDVLLLMAEGEMAVGQRRGVNYWDGYRRRAVIVAWMSLPEPYRGE